MIYDIYVYDDKISEELQVKVWKYVLDSKFYSIFYDPPAVMWDPRTKTYGPQSREYPSVHRLPLAWDINSLKNRSPIISELWEYINKNVLDNKYEINGKAENITKYMTGISPVYKTDKNLGSGWRVYLAARGDEFHCRTKAIHRDNPVLDHNGYYTLVYFANPRWFPSWYCETIFFNNDPDEKTGDYTGLWESDQPRNHAIGDSEKVIIPSPGRIMLFDSRYLHSVKGSALYAEELVYAVVFRLRKKGITSDSEDMSYKY
jgi:hypothetical protein